MHKTYVKIGKINIFINQSCFGDYIHYERNNNISFYFIIITIQQCKCRIITNIIQFLQMSAEFKIHITLV